MRIAVFAWLAACSGPTQKPQVVSATSIQLCNPGPPTAGCFLQVQPGSFLYGAQATDRAAKGFDPDAAANEGPPTQAETAGFWMQATEISYWMYQECLREGGCSAPPAGQVPAPPQIDAPVTSLTHAEAGELCAWLGGRLPTGIEWERVAKADDGRRFSWGPLPQCPSMAAAEMEAVSQHRDRLMGRCGEIVAKLFIEVDHDALDRAGLALIYWDEARMDAACAAARAAPNTTTAFIAEVERSLTEVAFSPVQMKCVQSTPLSVTSLRSAHPWGFIGLSGNVYEWVNDDAGDDKRGVRGGSFLSERGVEWRTTSRETMPATLRAADVGVRCVREVAP